MKMRNEGRQLKDDQKFIREAGFVGARIVFLVSAVVLLAEAMAAEEVVSSSILLYTTTFFLYSSLPISASPQNTE